MGHELPDTFLKPMIYCANVQKADRDGSNRDRSGNYLDSRLLFGTAPGSHTSFSDSDDSGVYVVRTGLFPFLHPDPESDTAHTWFCTYISSYRSFFPAASKRRCVPVSLGCPDFIHGY